MEKGDPNLAISKKTISVQDAWQEKSTDEVLSPQGPEPPLISTCIQPHQEISTLPDETSELFSDIATFLGTRGSSLAIIENPPIPGSAPHSQPESERDDDRPIYIVIAYDSADEQRKNNIVRDLRTLSRQKYNIKWDAYEVNEPTIWVTDVADPLNACDLILFLLSPEFVSSDFCYGDSVSQAVDRHTKGVWVLPIVLRPCHWKDTPFGQVPVLPRNQLPVADWPREDNAFFDIAAGIKRVLENIGGRT